MDTSLLFVIACLFVRTIKPRTKAGFFQACREVKKKEDILILIKDLFKTYPFPHTVKYQEIEYPLTLEVKKQMAKNLYAVGTSCYAIAQTTNYRDFLIQMVIYKAKAFRLLNDLGAFGDLIEICLHLLVCREKWRVNMAHLHVMPLKEIDIRYNGQPIEVGTNGKTWSQSLKDDPMNGKFLAVIYGVFSDDEKADICKLIVNGEVEKGLNEIASMLYYFDDKAQFFNLMQNNVGRSETIVWKKSIHRYQTVYNAAKHSAFLRMVDEHNIPTFREILGENEILQG